jgi:hypothetical protein
MTSPMQPLDPIAANDPVTPHDTPSSPAGFASVTPHGQGPAPYDIQAEHPDLTGTFEAAGALTASGLFPYYPAQSPRQADAEALLKSPPGYQDFDIYGGFSGQGATTHGWPNDVGPPGS